MVRCVGPEFKPWYRKKKKKKTQQRCSVVSSFAEEGSEELRKITQPASLSAFPGK
jgi:hypothetical protein